MTPNDPLTRVVVIGEPGLALQQVSSALDAENEFELVGVFSNPERLSQELFTANPDIGLVESRLAGEPTLDLIDDLALQFPEMILVAILPSEDPLLAQQVTLAGAQAFLVQPFTQVNLLSTLRRVKELQTRRQKAQPAQVKSSEDSSKPPRTLVVFSPRGGVGTSTVAVNLAIALYEATGGNILLMEGKLFFGHLDVMLNLRTRNSLIDLIPHASALDETLVRDVTIQHISGIRVLLAPSEIQAAQGVRPQDIYNVVNGLQRYYDFIVIDAGSSMTENTVTLMDAADRIIEVASPDMASLHDISRFTRISQTLAYPKEKILLVLNCAGRQGGIKSTDIESVLHQPIFCQIPDDSINAMRSLNRGVPLIINAPRSPASKAYAGLARYLASFRPPSSEEVRATEPVPNPRGA